MKLISKFLLSVLVLGFPLMSSSQTVKISQLPLQPAASTNASDSVPMANITNNTTWRLQVGDLQNLPGLVGKYAPLLSPTFTGPVTVNGVTISTGGFSGNLTGNASTASALAANPLDCSAGQYANAIAANGDLTCAAVQTSQLSGNVSLTTQVTGTLPIANGGTGQTTQTAAFDALSPTTTNGDLVIRGSSNNKRLAVGADGYVLISDSSVADGSMRWGPSPGTPPGMVAAFALTACPAGWVNGDGSAVSRGGIYADLFSAMGTIHGTGDGSTTFNLPNYQGRFLRGWANGSSLDPDRASRTAMATGGATGDNVGSVQTAAYASHIHAQAPHTHSVGNGLFNQLHGPDGTATGGAVRGIYGSSIASGIPVSAMATTPPDMAASGGSETRPVNAYVLYCVKL